MDACGYFSTEVAVSIAFVHVVRYVGIAFFTDIRTLFILHR